MSEAHLALGDYDDALKAVAKHTKKAPADILARSAWVKACAEFGIAGGTGFHPRHPA